MDHILITRDRLDVAAIQELVLDDGCGAISLFIGTTRDNFDGKKVHSLEYESYEPMAIKEMQAICGEMRTRWSEVVNIAIYHRVGLVNIREASVVIAVSSPHRKDSIDGMTFAIEELKRRVPIWKKEKYDGEESAWKENKECPNANGSRKRRKSMDFDKCNVHVNPSADNMVQIRAKEDEIEKRIKKFVQRKRDEINYNNIGDFTTHAPTEITNIDDDDCPPVDVYSCARADSAPIKQEHSKYHLRVRRVENPVGPQTTGNYFRALDKLMLHGETKIKSELQTRNVDPHKHSTPLYERLLNIEKYLNVPTTGSESLNERLKTIENRILYLESVSPEYKHFLMNEANPVQGSVADMQSENFTQSNLSHHTVYSLSELDSAIKKLKETDESYPYALN